MLRKRRFLISVQISCRPVPKNHGDLISLRFIYFAVLFSTFIGAEVLDVIFYDILLHAKNVTDMFSSNNE